MMLLSAIDKLLEHIKTVEKDTIELTKESSLRLTRLLEKHNLEIDADTAEAMQYQDIISQQLNATIDAIESVQQNIEHFNRAYKEDETIASASIEKLQGKLSRALEKAQEKRQAFSGNVHHENDDDAIEFF